MSHSRGKMTILLSGDIVFRAVPSLTKSNFKEFYIGGIPQDLRERYVLWNFPLDM